MAATVGELVVNLTARTAQFNRGLQTSGRQVGTWSKGIETAGRRVAAWGGTMLGIASVGGLATMIKRQLDLMDSTGKLSDRIGIATEELQGLRHAAEITGAGTETLDKSLQFLSKTFGEALGGIGEGKAALEKLKLSAEELSRLPLAEAVRLIADRFRALDTQAEKSYVATKLFGRSGMALVNTLELGSEGLREMRAEAERLGISFTREVAKGAEDANDAITRLKASLTGLITTKTGELAPNIKAAVDKVRELVELFQRERTGPGAAFLDPWANVKRHGEAIVTGIFGVPPPALERLAPPPPPAGIVAHRRLMEELYGEEAQKAVAKMNRQREEIENAWGQSMMAAAEAEAEAIAERRQRIRGMLESILGAAGGDGGRLGLPGAVGQQSAEAYSILVRHMMGPTQKRERTDQQILQILRQQLELERQTARRIEELMGPSPDLQEAHF